MRVCQSQIRHPDTIKKGAAVDRLDTIKKEAGTMDGGTMNELWTDERIKSRLDSYVGGSKTMSFLDAQRMRDTYEAALAQLLARVNELEADCDMLKRNSQDVTLLRLRLAVARLSDAERRLIRQLFIGKKQTNVFDAAFGDLIEEEGVAK